MSQSAPFLNPDPLTCWSGPENIAWVKIDDKSSWSLLDSGSTINMVTPEFVKVHSLDVGPLSNLVDHTLKINGFGGLFSWPMGYVIIRVQVEGVRDYDEDQVALVIPDLTAFGLSPVTLGTPTINQIVNVFKESEIDEPSVSLNGLRISHLLAGHWAELFLKNDTTASQTPGPTGFEWSCKNNEMRRNRSLLSKIVHGYMKTVLLGNNIYIMTQALEKGEEHCLTA